LKTKLTKKPSALSKFDLFEAKNKEIAV